MLILIIDFVAVAVAVAVATMFVICSTVLVPVAMQQLERKFPFLVCNISSPLDRLYIVTSSPCLSRCQHPKFLILYIDAQMCACCSIKRDQLLLHRCS